MDKRLKRILLLCAAVFPMVAHAETTVQHAEVLQPVTLTPQDYQAFVAALMQRDPLIGKLISLQDAAQQKIRDTAKKADDEEHAKERAEQEKAAKAATAAVKAAQEKADRDRSAQAPRPPDSGKPAAESPASPR